jgi:predicted RNA binding protein YcfA (HicA-like mRNA interferase family)
LGKLRQLSGRQVCDILKRFGFVRVRQTGSHIIMRLQTPGAALSLPVPDHKELRRGTLRTIIRQSGLPKEEFES